MLLTKKAQTGLLASLLLISFLLAVWADDASKDEETLGNVATVLQAMLDAKSVPSGLLAKADCVIVLPSVKFVSTASGPRHAKILTRAGGPY